MNKFNGNVRSIVGLDDAELRAAMQGGWNKELPAIKDEHGIILVGHRRLRVAKELGIDPVIKVVMFGDGPDAEAARIRLANVSNIGAAPMTKEDRARQAERLYKSGMTMEAIGHMLGVAKSTISEDLRNCSTIEQSKPAKTASNPKGSGRHKGAARPRAERAPKAKDREERVATLRDAGLSAAEIASEVGLGLRAVHQALEHVEIREEAVAKIDPATLSLSAQQKLEAAKNQQMRELASQFEQRVRHEVKKRIDEMILPHWKEQIEKAKMLYNNRKALMDKETFNVIRRALHPDSRNSISDKKLGDAFDQFMKLEKFLLNEKDSPTDFGELPSSLAEWDKMRAKRKTTPVKRAGAVTR